jgi:hypothetical protein
LVCLIPTTALLGFPNFWLWALRFTQRNDVRFVFTASCFRRVHVLFTLCVHSGVQHILCCVFVLFFFVLAVSLHCPFVLLPLQYSLTFIFLDKQLFCMVFDCLPYIANIYNCTYKTKKIETEYRGIMDHRMYDSHGLRFSSIWVNHRFVYVSLFYFLILYLFICCFVFILNLVPLLLYIWIVYYWLSFRFSLTFICVYI